MMTGTVKKMDSKNILEVLQGELAHEREATGDQEGATKVLLQGQNPASAKNLSGRGMTIRYFPFHIGRMGSNSTSSGEEPDLFLEDRRPYHISRLHITLERRGKEILLIDRNSRSGSMVDNIPLGGRLGGARELALSPGKHEIRLGGKSSPFSFTLDVVPDHDMVGINEQVRFGNRTVPVSALYSRLYQQTGMLFRHFFVDPRKSLEMAHDLVESMLNYPEAIEPLYYFSAVPAMYDDLIVTHSLNVAICIMKLAAAIPLPRGSEDRKRLALGALLHDIGMYDVPAEIVNKRDMITAEEYELIKRHPIQGQIWLREAGNTDDLLPAIALTHHERIDGQGYPQGIEALSEYAELIAMVDFFEAVTHYRPQRGPITPHEGIRGLIDLKKAIFSPHLLKQFITAFSLYPVYSVVRLNTGEIGQVVKTDRNRPLCPTVRIFFTRNGKAVSKGPEIDLAKERHVYIVKDISDRAFVDHYFKL
jgi:HD-GYP domain-containing protein (c-di-GMP phosphodiesterase class II)